MRLLPRLAIALLALGATSAGARGAAAQETTTGVSAPPTLLFRTERTTAPRIDPVVIGEFDLRLHSAKDEAEGNDGFAMRRIDLGAYAILANWATVLADVEFANREGPIILDAFLSLRPLPWLEVNLGPTKTPLFSSAHDELTWMLPVPELPMSVQALWPGRDAGVEAHVLPSERLPLEAWFRVGNGSGAALGNDNSDFAVDGRLDVALGRARPGARASLPWGLRLGSGIHAKSVFDRPGVAGETADAFEFYRPVTVSGPETIAEAHAVLFAGPFKITAEGGQAHQSRAEDAAGSATGPVKSLPSVRSRGGYVEAAWMITGQHRVHGAWPVSNSIRSFLGGGVEVAARVDRLDLDRGASDVVGGGGTMIGFSARWWATRFFALAVAGYHTQFDAPPVEEPTTVGTWLAISRLTIFAP